MDLSGTPTAWVHTSQAQRLVAGPGAIDQLGGALKDLGVRRVMVVTSAGRVRSDAGERLLKRLGRVLVATFAEAEAHVPVPLVRKAVTVATDANVDAVVSLGGGSCADLAKAVAFFTEQQRGIPATTWFDRPALPHIAVPTTWSGAELTWSFGLMDPVSKRKQMAGSPTCAPVLVIYDPLAPLGLDPIVSAGSGMNCLAHGIETAWARGRTPEAEAVGLACVARTVEALPAVVDDPFDIDAVAAMQAAASLGGRSLLNAMMGVHHGLAQLVGAMAGISHGLANGILLGHTVAYNAADPLLSGSLHRIGVALGEPDDPAGAIHRLRERIGLPAHLRDVGVTEDHLDAVAALAPAHPLVAANPRPVSSEDARAILDAAF